MNHEKLSTYKMQRQKSFIHGSLLLLFILFFVAVNEASAQQPDSLWTKFYGDIGYDRAHSMTQTSDGGLAIIGEFGGFMEAGIRRKGQVWLVKTDATGDTLWTKTYEGSDYDSGNAIRQTSDGGYILAGYTSVGPFSAADAWLIRTDAIGDTLWTRTYGSNAEESANDVIETADGGFVFTGFAWSASRMSQDAWLVKTDSMGDTLWTGRFYSGDATNVANAVLETEEGGYAVVGTTRMYGQTEDLLLFRADENGKELWTKTYNKTSNTVDNGRDIIEIENDGFMVLGFSEFSSWLLRTDTSGDTLWTKKLTFNGQSFKQTHDGGFIITGSGLERTDSDGNTLWTKSNLGGISNSVLQTNDGGYVISGYALNYSNNTLEDLWIFRLGPEGNYSAVGIPKLSSPLHDAIDVLMPVILQWDSAENADEYSIQVAEDAAFSTIAAYANNIAETSFETDDLDFGKTYHWRVRSHGDGSDSNWSEIRNFTVTMATSNQSETEFPDKAALRQNYPNPFNPVTIIGYDLPYSGDVRLEVFDLIGRQVALLIDNPMQPGRHMASFDASGLSSGIYIYRLQIQSGDQTGQIFTRKLTVVK